MGLGIRSDVPQHTDKVCSPAPALSASQSSSPAPSTSPRGILPSRRRAQSPLRPDFIWGKPQAPHHRAPPQPAGAQPLPKAACSSSGALPRGFVPPPARVAAPSSRAEPSGAGSPGTQLTLLRQRPPELGKTRAAACKWKCPAEPFEEAAEGRKGRQREEMAPNFWSPCRREHARPRAGSLHLPLLSRSHCSTRHSALRQPSPPAHLHLHTVFIPSKTQEGEDSSPVGHWGAASSPEGFEQQNPPSSTCSEAAAMVLCCRQAPELVPTPWHSYWHGVVPGGSHGTTFPGGKVFPSQPHSVVPSGEPSSRAGLQDAGTLVHKVLLVVSPKGAPRERPGASDPKQKEDAWKTCRETRSRCFPGTLGSPAPARGLPRRRRV